MPPSLLRHGAARSGFAWELTKDRAWICPTLRKEQVLRVCAQVEDEGWPRESQLRHTVQTRITTICLHGYWRAHKIVIGWVTEYPTNSIKYFCNNNKKAQKRKKEPHFHGNWVSSRQSLGSIWLPGWGAEARAVRAQCVLYGSISRVSLRHGCALQGPD